MGTDRELSMIQAARELGCERITVYRYVRDGRLPSHLDSKGRKVVWASDLEGVDVPPPGKPGTKRDHLAWTPAMTRKRAVEWNAAVTSGAFDNADGSVSAAKIERWEKRRGWTHADLEVAAAALAEKEAAKHEA